MALGRVMLPWKRGISREVSSLDKELQATADYWEKGISLSQGRVHQWLSNAECSAWKLYTTNKNRLSRLYFYVFVWVRAHTHISICLSVYPQHIYVIRIIKRLSAWGGGTWGVGGKDVVNFDVIIFISIKDVLIWKRMLEWKKERCFQDSLCISEGKKINT